MVGFSIGFCASISFVAVLPFTDSKIDEILKLFTGTSLVSVVIFAVVDVKFPIANGLSLTFDFSVVIVDVCFSVFVSFCSVIVVIGFTVIAGLCIVAGLFDCETFSVVVNLSIVIIVCVVGTFCIISGFFVVVNGFLFVVTLRRVVVVVIGIIVVVVGILEGFTVPIGLIGFGLDVGLVIGFIVGLGLGFCVYFVLTGFNVDEIWKFVDGFNDDDGLDEDGFVDDDDDINEEVDGLVIGLSLLVAFVKEIKGFCVVNNGL